MENILMIVHIIIVLMLILVVLLQRSEGGVLGIGGGQGAFMSGRSAANVMTRTTTILAFLFVCSSLGLTWVAGTFEDANLRDEIKMLEQKTPDAVQENTSSQKPAVPLSD
ncbi:MAG: preprotein translocase subunit SecG [Alphaproteobacteria bacterium]